MLDRASAKGPLDGRLRGAPLPLGLLLPRRCVAAGGAGRPCARARLRNARADRPRQLCGALEFAHAAKAMGLRPITGCELTVSDEHGCFHVTLLVETRTGYSNLWPLLTARTRPTASSRARRLPVLCDARRGARLPDGLCAPGRARARGDEADRAGALPDALRGVRPGGRAWSSCSGRCGRGDRARNRSPARAGAPALRPARGARPTTCTRTTGGAGALQDALVAIRTHLPLEGLRGRAARQPRARAQDARARWRSCSATCPRPRASRSSWPTG